MNNTALERGYMLYSDIKWECTHDNQIIGSLKISTKDGSRLYPFNTHLYPFSHDCLTVPMMCEQCFKKKRLLLALGGRKLEWMDR